MSTETTPDINLSAPTKTATDFELSPPDPVPQVAPEKASGLVPVPAEEIEELNGKVDDFIAKLTSMDANSPEFGATIDKITNMGQDEIRKAADMSNDFLGRPVRAMDSDSDVGKNLIELRQKVEELDPSTKKKLLEPRRLFGIIPFGSRLKDYFDSYESAQGHIKDILENLEKGQRELIQDNSEINVVRGKLWETMGRLEKLIHMAKVLDERLETKANDLDISDPEKAKALRESALFYVRQRTQDLLTQMAVSVQGYLALDLVKKNNIELVKGVDRASNTTVAALSNAVTVAQAMANQTIVLDQIAAVNQTTANMIDSTGELLRQNTARVHEQAASSTIPLETLQRAFQNIYDTMDEVDNFKVRALDSMKQTVNVLSDEVEKSKGYIARAEGQAQAQENLAKSEPSLLALD